MNACACRAIVLAVNLKVFPKGDYGLPKQVKVDKVLLYK